MELEDALDAAVQQCVDEGILADYLKDKRAKVKDMFLTEYDEAKVMRQLREEAIEMGIEEGIEKGIEKGRAEEHAEMLARVAGKVKTGVLSLQDAIDLGFSQEELEGQLDE